VLSLAVAAAHLLIGNDHREDCEPRREPRNRREPRAPHRRGERKKEPPPPSAKEARALRTLCVPPNYYRGGNATADPIIAYGLDRAFFGGV